MTDARANRWAAGAAAALITIGVAGALVPLRDPFGNTNMALVLVVVVVAAAAFGGRVTGVVAAVAASLAYNFFHTQPYLTLHVNDRKDVTTVVLLLIVGLIVGELATLHSASRAKAVSQAAGARRLEQVAGLVAAARPVDEVWPVVRQAITDELGLQGCRFEPSPYAGNLPAVSHSGKLEGQLHWAKEGFELPLDGSQLAVEHDGRLLGRLVLDATPGRGVTMDQRKVAIALADQLGVALDRAKPLSALS
jgi:K+-sensing histidine kinase KdpD